MHAITGGGAVKLQRCHLEERCVIITKLCKILCACKIFFWWTVLLYASLEMFYLLLLDISCALSMAHVGDDTLADGNGRHMAKAVQVVCLSQTMMRASAFFIYKSNWLGQTRKVSKLMNSWRKY